MQERHTSYTDETIITGINEVMASLNIDRMPSRNEIFTVTKNHKLDNAIQRSYKYSGWAEKLNLKLKASETSFGKEYENIAILDILQNTGFDSEKMSQNYPFDLLVDSFIRVDVKVGRRYYYNDSNYFHSFNLEKKYPVCDLFVVYCINDENNIEKKLIIPSSKLQVCQISVGVKSRYDVYRDNWGVFEKYSKFYAEVM
jgi:hypothetical protein